MPGVGTPTFPDFEIYCKKFKLETYDRFLILTKDRFTYYDLLLAQKINSLKKSFFLIRTQIDNDEWNENHKKSPDVEKMLERIRACCYEYVKMFGIGIEKIFLISNRYKEKWDFHRLYLAILETLSNRQKEALALSLSCNLLSKDIVRETVKVLRGMLPHYL